MTDGWTDGRTDGLHPHASPNTGTTPSPEQRPGRVENCRYLLRRLRLEDSRSITYSLFELGGSRLSPSITTATVSSVVQGRFHRTAARSNQTCRELRPPTPSWQSSVWTRAEGWDTVRWITADDNYRARAKYDQFDVRTTWITDDMPPAEA